MVKSLSQVDVQFFMLVFTNLDSFYCIIVSYGVICWKKVLLPSEAVQETIIELIIQLRVCNIYKKLDTIYH
jgi:hypothetical protein